jgi:hypothetical protein
MRTRTCTQARVRTRTGPLVQMQSSTEAHAQNAVVVGMKEAKVTVGWHADETVVVS